MGTRIINNKRSNDTNIQKNRVVVPSGQEFTMPGDTIRTISERDAVVAALQVFATITERGLKIPGRDLQKDEDLLIPAQLVLGRIL